MAGQLMTKYPEKSAYSFMPIPSTCLPQWKEHNNILYEVVTVNVQYIRSLLYTAVLAVIRLTTQCEPKSASLVADPSHVSVEKTGTEQ